MSKESRHLSGPAEVHEAGNPADYFDAFADSGYYELDAEASGWPATAERLVEKALSHRQVPRVRSALDLGAGTGISIDATRIHARPEHTVAVDASPKMLARLRQGYFGGDTTIVEASIGQYVEDCDERFDLITSMAVMEMVPELPNTLCRTAMLLNRGGILAFTYMPLLEGEPREEVVESPQISQNIRRYRWLPEEVEQVLTARGLTIAYREDVADAYKHNPNDGPTVAVDYNFVVARADA